MMRIELLGTTFQIQSDEQPEYLERVLDHVRGRVDEIKRTVATDDPLKIAILASFLITDDLFREQATKGGSAPPAEEASAIARITTQLIERIDQALPAEEFDEREGEL